jgi:hypothetical protein
MGTHRTHLLVQAPQGELLSHFVLLFLHPSQMMDDLAPRSRFDCGSLVIPIP